MPLSGPALQIIACVAVSAGFLCFGYDQSVANPVTASPDWKAKFPTLVADPTKLGAVLGAFVLGAGVGCLFLSLFSGGLGRKPILQIGVLITLLGTGLQAGSVNLGMWVAARIINGFGVGIVTSVAPTLMGELASPKWRGRLMAMELVIGSLGLMLGFIMSYAYSGVTNARGWREPLAWQAPPILITLVCSFFLPESPRYLAEKGQLDKAEAILIRLRGTQVAAQELLEIREAIALEHAVQTGWSSMLRKDPQCLRYRAMLNWAVNILQQLTGINMATYYAGQIIGTFGFTPYRANILIIMLGLVGHIGAQLGCFVLIDRIGRIKLLMLGSTCLAIGQAFLAGGVAHIETSTGAGVAAFGLFLFIFSFSGTWLPGGWLYGPEITPLAIRAKASGVGYMLQFLFNFFIVEITPVAIDALTYKFYIIFAIVNALTVPLLYFFFPETANLSLEEIDCLFVDGKVIVRHDANAPVSRANLDNAIKSGHPYEEEKDLGAEGHYVERI